LNVGAGEREKEHGGNNRKNVTHVVFPSPKIVLPKKKQERCQEQACSASLKFPSITHHRAVILLAKCMMPGTRTVQNAAPPYSCDLLFALWRIALLFCLAALLSI
jgi:hypothetical protein